MAAKKQSARGRKQHRASGGRARNEAGYETKKTTTSRPAVRKAVKKIGNWRERMERRLGR